MKSIAFDHVIVIVIVAEKVRILSEQPHLWHDTLYNILISDPLFIASSFLRCHFPRQRTYKSNLEGSGMTRQSGLPLYVSVYSAWESKDSEATRIQ